MTEWYSVEGQCDVIGATLTNVKENLFLVGGKIKALDGTFDSPYLRLENCVMPGLQWQSMMVNTNGHLNRAYHATVGCSKGERLYVFGGELTAQPVPTIADSVLQISTTSVFGAIVDTIETPEELVQKACNRTGLTATTIGTSDAEAVILFGGKADAGDCSSDMLLFLPNELEYNEEMAQIATNLARQEASVAADPEGADPAAGAAAAEAVETVAPASCFYPLSISADVGDRKGPSGRAFHTASLAGPGRDKLVVFAGQDTNGALLSDVWIADLAALYESVKARAAIIAQRTAKNKARAATAGVHAEGGSDESKGGEGEEEGGEEELPDLVLEVTWHLLRESSEVLPACYRHSAYCAMAPAVEGADPDPSYYLSVFGGISASENPFLGGSVYTLQIEMAPEENEPDEEGNGVCDGTPRATDFKKSSTIVEPSVATGSSSASVSGEPAMEEHPSTAQLSQNASLVQSQASLKPGSAIGSIAEGSAVLDEASLAYLADETPKQPLYYPFCSSASCSVGNDIGSPVCLTITFDGANGYLLVTDSTDEAALAVKKECIRKIKEAKAAAAAAMAALRGDSQVDMEPEESLSLSGLPKKVQYANGDVYQGDLKLPPDFVEGDPIVPVNLIRHGRGKLDFADGSNYTGQWMEDKMHGFGDLITADGLAFDGTFESGMKAGEGIIRRVGRGASTEGDEDFVYKGNWKYDLYDGEGTLNYDNGDKYIGSFKAGKRHGKGQVIAGAGNGTDSFSYTGDWCEDAIAGTGMVNNLKLKAVIPLEPVPVADLATTLSQTTNTGKLDSFAEPPTSPAKAAQSERSASFSELAKGGGKGTGYYSGPTRNGIPYGKEGYVAYQDGSQYIGQWIHGKRSGYGKLVLANGTSYEGKFVGGERRGFGVLECKDGTAYRGDFDGDCFHGPGSLVKEGKQYTGKFEMGVFIG